MKVGFVPEHFSTPLWFAKNKGYFEKYGVNVEFIPFPSGTGHMIQSLKSKEIDIGVGLTEAFVSGIGKGSDWYKIVGTYVQSPLCWAISTGANRTDMNNVEDVKDKTIGISRIGSGSYVMPFVLAKQKGWDGKKFNFKVQTNFENLRSGVNQNGKVEDTDAFMWEVFTTKKYYDNGELKQIGEIYTPWQSWVIAAEKDTIGTNELENFFKAVNDGVQYFNNNNNEAVENIAEHLDYTADDAREWLKTVEFVKDVSKVDDNMINKTIDILQSAEVLEAGVEKLQYVA